MRIAEPPFLQSMSCGSCVSVQSCNIIPRVGSWSLALTVMILWVLLSKGSPDNVRSYGISKVVRTSCRNVAAAAGLCLSNSNCAKVSAWNGDDVGCGGSLSTVSSWIGIIGGNLIGSDWVVVLGSVTLSSVLPKPFVPLSVSSRSSTISTSGVYALSRMNCATRWPGCTVCSFLPKLCNSIFNLPL